MFIDNINLNNLRIFESVYRHKCMTKASKQLHLTQSGVSQHIKALEESLEVKLFDRLNKKIMPTDAGEKLYKQARTALFQIEDVITEISHKEQDLEGIINIGMPMEFGNNVIIPELAKLGQAYPNLQFNLQLDLASNINQKLLTGELDFAFVDEFNMDRRILVKQVAEENFELVAHKDFLKKFGATKSSKAYFEKIDFVAYQEGEPVLRRWFAHHIKRKNLNLQVRAHVMDVHGIAKFIKGGLGAGILPGHVVAQLKDLGHPIHVFKGSGKPLTNKISIAYLKNRSRSHVVKTVLAEVLELF